MRCKAWLVLCTAGVLVGCASTPDRSSALEGIEAAEAQTARAIELFEEGERARRGGRAEEAMDLYRQSIVTKSNLPEPWNQLGVLLMDQGNLLDAADAFRNALVYSRPEDPRPAENLGLVYARAGWGEESLRYYEMALERAPNSQAGLRGAIKAGRLLGVADEAALDRVMTGLLVEADPEWKEFYLREKFRIEERLRVAEAG